MRSVAMFHQRLLCLCLGMLRVNPALKLAGRGVGAKGFAVIIVAGCMLQVAGFAQELFVDFSNVAAGTTDSAINMGTISRTNGSAVTFSWSGPPRLLLSMIQNLTPA